MISSFWRHKNIKKIMILRCVWRQAEQCSSRGSESLRVFNRHQIELVLQSIERFYQPIEAIVCQITPQQTPTSSLYRERISPLFSTKWSDHLALMKCKLKKKEKITLWKGGRKDGQDRWTDERILSHFHIHLGMTGRTQHHLTPINKSNPWRSS